MGFLKPRIRLTETSYGYQPPSGATVCGWRCSNMDCNAGDDDVPRRGWPYPCPRCGAATDPAFAEPWKHAARGAEIRYLLANGVEDGGFTENELYLWRHRDALLTQDAAGARQVRAEFRAARDADDEEDLLLGSGYFTLVDASLSAGDFDAAAEDLLDWFDRTEGGDIEQNPVRRSNCRQIVGSTISFLDTPGAARHRQAAEIRGRCLELAETAYSGLLPEQQDRIVEMSRAS